MMRRLFVTLGLLLIGSLAYAEQDRAAQDLYGRLLAPCCWQQTLDIHESDLATQLRVEIAQRLQAGEPGFAIEDDLAARYGERVRAVPRKRDPRQSMALFVVVAMVSMLLGLFALAFTWTRRRSQQVARASETLRDGYDDQLDRELRRGD